MKTGMEQRRPGRRFSRESRKEKKSSLTGSFILKSEMLKGELGEE